MIKIFKIDVREEELSAIAQVMMTSTGMEHERKLLGRMFRRNKYKLYSTLNADPSKIKFTASKLNLYEFVRRNDNKEKP